MNFIFEYVILHMAYFVMLRGNAHAWRGRERRQVSGNPSVEIKYLGILAGPRSYLFSPFSGIEEVCLALVFVEVRYFRHQRILRVGIREHGAYREQH